MISLSCLFYVGWCYTCGSHFKSKAVLISLWMSNLFCHLFPSPMCFVKGKDGASTEKPRQFTCHYRCQNTRSYFCVSSDHVDTLATFMSYRGAAAWQNRGCVGAWRDFFLLIISVSILSPRAALRARQRGTKVRRSLALCRASQRYSGLLTAPL